MSTSESLPVLLREFFDTEMKNALSHFEFKGIYNRHANNQDARDSVALVEPDSIVYIEGYSTQNFKGETLHDWARILSGLKREGGKDEGYYDFKDELLRKIISLQWQDNQREKASDDFSEHMLEQLRLLIEKDCDVLIADYRSIENSSVQDHVDRVSRFIEDSLDGGTSLDLSSIDTHRGNSKRTTALINETFNEADAHDLRELHAGIIIGSDAVEILQNPSRFVKAPRNADGKIRAYVIYGTAHAFSLSHRLEQMGASIEPSIINELPASRYFENDIGEFEANRRRRYALKAIKSVMYYMGVWPKDLSHDDFIEDLYSNLETMNDDRDRAFAFCVNCLKISAKSRHDFSGAARELEQLLQPYSASHVSLTNDF